MANLACPVRSETVMFQQDPAGNCILLDIQGGEYFALNGIGARVWELCDGSHSIDRMASIVASEYHASSEEVEEDLLSFIQELRDGKLVRLVAPAPGAVPQPGGGTAA